MIKGSTAGLSPELVKELEAFARVVGNLVITSGFRPGDTGEHGKGLAADIVPLRDIKLLDLYLTAERFGFKGIGVYPSWQLDGKKVGGLHLDVRTAAPGRWIGTGSGKSQFYVALDEANLRKYGVI